MEISHGERDDASLDNSTAESFLFTEGVKKPLIDTKDRGLKMRLRALILERGMKEEHEFFQSIGLSRQYWYRISWGLDECPVYLKIKIAKALDVDSIVIWEEVKE